jgi:hypothetical protein
VVIVLRDADTFQIFGPGGAKGELEKRIDQAGFKAHILAIETVDKLIARQIAAKVRERFQINWNLNQKTPAKASFS